MHQPVIVENMPGANGSLAAAQVARATPDGYTLMMAVDSNLVINPSLYTTELRSVPRFRPDQHHRQTSHGAGRQSQGAGQHRAGLDRLRQGASNKLNYASIGFGTAMHMGMELFKYDTHTEINQVSYRGTAPAMTDVVSGIVDVMFTGPPSAKAMSEGGKLKLLAVASPQRMPLMPDVPTVTEAGVPVSRWRAGSACWRRRRRRRISSSGCRKRRRRRRRPKFTNKMSAQGLDIVGSTPDAMLETMKSDTKKWSEVIKATDIKIP